MAFEKGNKLWQFRNKHGRSHQYTPESLWNEAIKYFEWVEDNPLYEEKLFAFQGEVTKASATKMRAMTISGFCLFADICEKTFANYRDNSDFVQLITRIEKIIYEQKFTGASADLLNANIIARDLGLADVKKDVSAPQINIHTTDSDAANELLDKLSNEE